MTADYLNICLDEIALEGLDGITLEALWVRLEDRLPTFPLKLDAKSKDYLWRFISVHRDVNFYELPKARGQLVLVDRFKFTDPSTGIFLEQDHYPEDIYPLEIICDRSTIGSCTTYRTRKNITNLIRTDDRKCLLCFEDVEKRWGRKLVIVATQEARQSALYGPEVDPSLVLPEKHYCILERIGRARRQGELTHGKHSLLIFGEPSKTIFYLRKVLVRHGLITVQPFNQKLTNGTNGAGKCLHLKRFFVEYKPIYLGLLENLTQRLSNKPRQTEALTVIRSEMNMRDASFKKLYQFGGKYVKTEMIPHKEFYPDSTKEEYMIKVGTKERFIRVLTLKKLYKYSSESKSDDEEGSDGEDVEGSEKTEVWNRVVELPLLHQAYQFARSKGEKGASQTDFRQAFRASKLDGRLMARNLDRLGMVKTILQDVGKQRVQMFVAKEFIAGSTIHKKLQEEKDKIVKLIAHEKSRVKEGTPAPETPSSSRAPSPAPATLERSPQSPVAGPSQQDDDSLAIKEESKSDSMLDLSALDDTVPLIDRDNAACEKYHFKKRGAHVTYRLLKRANYILKAVQEAKLVDNIYQIQKKIIDDEAAEGYSCRCDKKSLLRLIERLARDGQIKSIKTLIKYGNEEKQLHFLCDPSIQATDQIVTSAIEAAKLRHIAVSKEFSKEIRKGEKSEPNLEHADVNIPNYGLLRSQLTMDDMQYDSDAGRRYGYKPRMLRLQLIHQLLFYLVHDYDLDAAKVFSETVQPISDADREKGQSLIESIQELKVYCNELNWKRFIPPLPKHREYEDSWCLIGDVLLRLPVTIFCQIIRVNFKIAGLDELLAHPLFRYLTVGKLPSHMRQQLMIERKYIFSFYSNCISLCLMGLIAFGKREWKQKEQIFIHVNRRASLIDSTEVDEPINERPVEEFEFHDMSDLDNYWFRLQWICLNTPLDAIVINADPIGTNHSHAVKIERFTPYLEGHLPEEVIDDGTLPGNKLGAAGLDSTFYGHLRRNWSASGGNLKAETLISENKRKLITEGRNIVKRPRKKYPRSTSADPPLLQWSQMSDDDEYLPPKPKSSGKAGAATKATSPSGDKRKIEIKKVAVEAGKAPRGGKGVRRKAATSTETEAATPAKRRKANSDPVERKPPVRKTELDQVDRDALKRMTKERVMWTPQEDSLLLLCEVASSILGGIRRDFLVQFTIVRDLMHKNFTTSLDKTSKACQRRIRYIMKNPETIANVNMYKGEALQDKDLVEDFVTGKKYRRTPKHTASLNKVFNDLVERLREKFKNAGERAPLHLPPTQEEVHKRYILSRPAISRKSQHKPVTCIKDIHFSVLHNVIHSAMVIQDKSGHANELYHVFSQYPDDLLQSVFNQMRADGIVTKIKAYAVNKSNEAGRRTMPGPSVAIGNYQMAQRYTYKWFSRYRKFIFLQAYSLLEQLNSEAEREVERDKQDQGGDHTEARRKDRRLIPMKDEGVYAAVAISMMVQRKCLMETVIPDQVIVVESQYMSKQKNKQKKKKFADLEKEYHLGTASDEEEEALIEEAEKAREIGEDPKDYTAYKSKEGSNLSLDAEWENKKTTSRTSLVLFRSQYANGPISVRMLAPQDHIVINSCKVNMKMADTCAKKKAPEPTKTFKNNHDHRCHINKWNSTHSWIHHKTYTRSIAAMHKVEPMDIDLNAFYFACIGKWNFSLRKIAIIRQIIGDITEMGELGVPVEDIWRRYARCRGLVRMIAAVTEHHVVRRVGVTMPRYVAHQYLKPWLVHSYKNLRGSHLDKSKRPPRSPPFDFGPYSGTVVLDPEIEEEDLQHQLNVTPWPQEDEISTEILPEPPKTKFRMLSRVRSTVLEEVEPKEDENQSEGMASQAQAKKTTENLSEPAPKASASNGDPDPNETLITVEEKMEVRTDVDISSEAPSIEVERESVLSRLSSDTGSSTKGASPKGKLLSKPGSLPRKTSMPKAVVETVVPSPPPPVSVTTPESSTPIQTIQGATHAITSQVPMPSTSTSLVTLPSRGARVRLPRPVTSGAALIPRALGPRLRMPTVQVIYPPISVSATPPGSTTPMGEEIKSPAKGVENDNVPKPEIPAMPAVTTTSKSLDASLNTLVSSPTTTTAMATTLQPGMASPTHPPPIVRSRRMSESMALYKKADNTPASAGSTERQEATVSSLKPVPHPSTTRTMAPSVARIPSMLTTRPLPSLENMNPRRVRTISECSDGKATEPAGTMLRLLEGITERIHSQPMDVCDTDATKQVAGKTVVKSPRSHLKQTPSKSPRSASASAASPRPKSTSQQSPRAALASTTKSPMSSPIMSPKGFHVSKSGQSSGGRSPRSLSEKAIIQMLQEPDGPRKPSLTKNPSVTPSPLSTCTTTQLYGPTSVPKSPVRSGAATKTVLSSKGPLPQQSSSIVSSIQQALKSPPAIHRINFSQPPKPASMSTDNFIASLAKAREPSKYAPGISKRRAANMNISTGLDSKADFSVASAAKQSPTTSVDVQQDQGQGIGVVAKPQNPVNQKESFIDVPVQHLAGYSSVQHFLHKSPQDTVRIKLPPGYKLPTGSAPFKFSIISEEQARHMGLSIPAASGYTTKKIVTGSTGGAFEMLRKQLSSPTKPAIGGEVADSKSKVVPSKPTSAMSPAAKASAAQSKPGKDDDHVPQVDGAGDDKPLEDSSKEVVSETDSINSDQGGTVKKKYSMYPKFKGCTPESNVHKLNQSVRLIPRPWRHTDGLVNKPTLKLMLESVLILIMSRPGIIHSDIIAQYNPILQPVPVIELLEMLEDIGCIRILSVAASHKSSLFSQRVELNYEVHLDSTKAYIPAVDCVLKLGQFESQLTAGMNPKMREAMEADYQ